jgi:hypothetical protein
MFKPGFTLAKPQIPVYGAQMNSYIPQQQIQPPQQQVYTPPAPIETNQPVMDNVAPKMITEEFKSIIESKMGKIDEILVAIADLKNSKVNQQATSISMESVKPAIQIPETIQSNISQPKKGKKTYYKITDNMWSNLKGKYPEINENCRDNTYSDGSNNYVEIKGKKILLDDKGYLKIINNIKKNN